MMIRRQFLQLLLLVLLAQWSCRTPQAPGTTQTPQPIEFIILQMNDVYEIAPLEGGASGGLARVASLKKQLLRENPNTIAVLSGDFLSPSFIGTLRMEDGDRIAGLQMVETLNAMGLDYVTFGNHEFDLSDPDLLQKRIDQSSFQYVTANAFRQEDGEVRPFTQKGDPVPPYLVRQFRNAQGDVLRLGITGVVLPFNQQDYVSYTPVEETFRGVYGELQNTADLVLVLSHLLAEQDIALAKAVPGPFLFAGGHDHVNMSFYVENTVITKADANAKTVYVHRGKYYPCSGTATLTSTLVEIDDSIPEDPATGQVVEKWLGMVDETARRMGFDPARKLGETAGILECTEAAVRSRPTNCGRLTTRALEAVWPDADVYLVNSGSIRLDDNIDGTITEYDVLRLYPFGGPVVMMELKGAELSKLLQIGLFTNRTNGGYFQTLYVDPAGNTFSVREKPIDSNKTYRVVLPKFVAEGRESNLGFLADYEFTAPESFTVSGGKTVQNDIRNIVIYFLDEVGKY